MRPPCQIRETSRVVHSRRRLGELEETPGRAPRLATGLPWRQSCHRPPVRIRKPTGRLSTASAAAARRCAGAGAELRLCDWNGTTRRAPVGRRVHARRLARCCGERTPPAGPTPVPATVVCVRLRVRWRSDPCDQTERGRDLAAGRLRRALRHTGTCSASAGGRRSGPAVVRGRNAISSWRRPPSSTGSRGFGRSWGRVDACGR